MFLAFAIAVGSLCLFALDTPAAPAAAPALLTTSVVLTDHARSTPASNGAPELPYRKLATLLLVPKERSEHKKPLPLVVYSHGFGATAASALPTVRSLAAHGYVVAAPDFPLTTAGLPGGLDLLDYAQQPGDVSFVITQMLKLDRTPGSPVYGEIDARRIGVMGHSLGAVTTLAVSYNSCCRDTRIKAAIEMDGELNVPIGPQGNFGGTYFKGHDPPLLMVNGSKDTIAPYPMIQKIYAQAPTPKYLLTLIGAPHEGFANRPWFTVVNNVAAAFFARYLNSGGSDAQIKRAGTKPGVATVQLHAS